MKNAAGYVRVSTAEQAKKGISIKNQKVRIRRYAEDNDLKIIEIFEDSGISGSKIKNRPGMRLLIDLINDKKAEAVVSYKLDRLFRNASDAITTLNWLKEKKVAFHSITEKIDTTTPLGKFFVGITALYAEMERDVLSERIRDNLKMKKLRGEKTGGHVPGCFIPVIGSTPPFVAITVSPVAFVDVDTIHFDQGLKDSIVTREQHAVGREHFNESISHTE